MHVESLARKHDRKAIRLALKHLPTELDDTYHEALERIYSQNKDDVLLAERVLSWISFARRPLTVKEMQHAIAVLNLEPDETRINEEGIPDDDLLVAVCAGIVTIDEENDVIRLVHYSTQQYFERIRDTRFPHAQTAIAQACLRYQSLDIFTNGYCCYLYEIECRLLEHPLLQYATLYWGHHAIGSSEHILKDKILEFISAELRISCCIQVARFTKGLSFDRRKFLGDNRLWLMAAFGLKEIIKVLLDGSVDIEASGPRAETALHIAARGGHIAVVQLLLDHNANTEATDDSGKTALHHAAIGGHEAVVKLLLDHTANVEARDLFGGTALHHAASDGEETIVQLLLKSGADINAKDNDGETALCNAAEYGHLEVVKLLVESGADVHAEIQNGWSPLDEAAKNGHLTVVRFFLTHEVFSVAGNKYRVRELFQAAYSRTMEPFQLLMDNCRENGVHEEILETAIKVRSGRPARITCDHCETRILDSDAHYHCNICDKGDFDLCQKCVNEGNFCRSGPHRLIKRSYVNEKCLEIFS